MTTQTEMTMNPVATNAFAWNEITTRDTEAVSTFYCALFGWTTKLAKCTAGYTVFKLGDNPVAGMIEMNDEWPEDTPTHWGSYIYVRCTQIYIAISIKIRPINIARMFTGIDLYRVLELPQAVIEEHCDRIR